MPDKLLLIDNTVISQVCLQAEKGIIQDYQSGFNWVEDFVNSLQDQKPVSAKTLTSIEEVRKLYETTKSQKTPGS